MKVVQKYVVYLVEKGMRANEVALTLPTPVSFWQVEFQGGIVENSFDTEEQAIQAIVEVNMCYREFVIMKHVFVEK